MTHSPALRDRNFDPAEPVAVSICCITFNHEAFIAQCLEGFLDQCCDFRVEVVIYDDASTDRTAAIIREYASRYPTVFRTILMEQNQFSKGVNPYFGHVFPAAHGEYLAICDGDDYWTDPNKLSRQVAVLAAEPTIALTYGPVRGVDESGAEVPHKGGIRRDLTADELKVGPPINTLTTCFRNIFRDKPVSLYIRTSPIGDMTVWAMLGYHGAARYLPDLPLANYRLHAGGMLSMQGRERQVFLTALAKMHIAAFHAEQDDALAFDDTMLSMTAQFNSGARSALWFKPGTPAPFSVKLRRLRKRFTQWRKSTLRRFREH